jgi:hypothetical protein
MLQGTSCDAKSVDLFQAVMNCRAFRDNHLSFLDDVLDEIELVEMQRHLAECASCARHDIAVRRGLIVFRNLAPIEPSADFSARLNARLREVRLDSPLGVAPARSSILGRAAIAAALGIAAVGYVAVASMDFGSRAPQELALPPVVASRPAIRSLPMTNSAIVASASLAMPMWPSALLAEEAPARFVRSEFHLASWSR